MGIVIASAIVCIGFIVIGASVLVTWRTQRARERLTASDESALDRALFHLINDLARDTQPEPAPLLRRTPRGTPSDAVLLGTRLRTLPAVQHGYNAFDDEAPTTVAVAYLFDSPRR